MIATWWQNAVVYQVYLRSFADGDGDGVGDLTGLCARLDYIADLGVDAIWLNPFYPSPLADGGYDVIDHCAVDPLLGTLEQFDDLVTDAHRRGLRVIIDIIPNHTSDQHPWFRDALAAPAGSAERDRYQFLACGSGPPSDWQSLFGGSAWQPTQDGQWYCHLFAPEQPDLNWSDESVRDRYREVLRFWADRGVDGFRVDAAHTPRTRLEAPLRSRPGVDQLLPDDGSDPIYDHDEIHEIYRDWRTVLDEYDPPRMAVAETWYPPNPRTYLYARQDELGQVFDFTLLKAGWRGDLLADAVRASIAGHAEVGAPPSWTLSSHDVVRAASRYALPPGVDVQAWLVSGGTDPVIDPEVGRRRARAAALLMLALPGAAYVYQGDELGLLEVADLPPEALRDPVWERTNHREKGRDGCRAPLPWTRTGPSFGFGEGAAWLPQPASFAACSVEALIGRPGSVLEMYRSAMRLRRTLSAAGQQIEWRDARPDLLHFDRAGCWTCVVNLGEQPIMLPAGQVLLTSSPLTDGLMPADTTVWVRQPSPDDPSN